jgi:hypothetical protein
MLRRPFLKSVAAFFAGLFSAESVTADDDMYKSVKSGIVPSKGRIENYPWLFPPPADLKIMFGDPGSGSGSGT